MDGHWSWPDIDELLSLQILNSGLKLFERKRRISFDFQSFCF